MADDVIDFEGIKLLFDDKSISSNGLNGKNDGIQRFYVGEIISLKLSLPLTASGQKKLKTSHPEKSPFAQNLQLAFMRQLSTTVDVKYSFRPFSEPNLNNQLNGTSQWITCSLISSLHEGSCSSEEMKAQPSLSKDKSSYHIPLQIQKAQPFLSKDKSSYHIPLQIQVPDIQSQCSTIQLEVQARSKAQPFLSKDKSSYHIPLQIQVPDIQSQCSTIQLEVQARSVSRHTPCWLLLKKAQPFLSKDKSSYHIPLQIQVPDIQSQCSTIQLEVQARSVSRHTPCWLSSPTRSEKGSVYQQQESAGLNTGKTVTLPLRIIHPPQIKFQQKSVAGKHMIFLQIKNMSAYYCIKIEECVLVPESSPKPGKTSSWDGKTQQSLLTSFGGGQHGNMVKMISGATEMFDNLSPSECYTLCYTLNTSDGIDSLAKEDLCLEVHIKWSIPYQQYGDHSSVLSTYRLPTMKVKQAPFVMSATLEESKVKKGECFTVLYNITNRLQDFLSITLNWSPNLSEETKYKGCWRSYQDGLICQDPCIELGPCTYGSSLQAKVRFQAISPGVYEVCKHMKINLRYLIPSSETVSLGSPCSQTSAEDLWRSRSGSGSSFIEQRNYPEVENKFSLASKSYSSGELGPDSVDYDTNQKYRGQPEDRSLFQKLEVPHSNKYEQILLSPGNFLKTSCEIYVC